MEEGESLLKARLEQFHIPADRGQGFYILKQSLAHLHLRNQLSVGSNFKTLKIIALFSQLVN